MEGAEVSNDAASIQSREVEMEAKQTAVESALEDCTDSVMPKAAQPGGEQECVKIAENGETDQDNDNPPEIATENIDAVDEQVLTKTAEVAKSVPSATAPDDETKSSATISQQHQQAAEVSEEEIIKEECVESVSKDDEETKGERSKDDETASAVKDDFDHTSEVKQVLTTVTDLPSTVPVDAEQQKQDNLSVTLKEIISDIDREIERQEDAIRSQQPEQTADKRPTCDQQTMTQPITNESVSQGETLLQGESTFDQKLPASQPQQQSLPSQTSQTVSKSTSFTEKHDESSYMCRKESYEVQESSNVSKKIDLQKIFTPATDAEEIVPKNRKLYASSAFYSPTLHPTVEDQVELARRISHSLSDVNNQQSKGQSMYVNRKKRSVKWVHEGSGQAKLDCSSNEYEYGEESKENTDYNNVGPQTTTSTGLSKVPLKLVMNPRGQIRDFNSVGDTLNIETGLMSPNKCAELVSALNAQKGKGAELFAKRRRKAEKWVVDETNASTQNPSGLPDYHHYQPKPATSPNCLPAYSDAGKHRVQLNMQQEQLLEKYSKPGVKSLKTPWEAALETGSASTAFEDNDSPSLYVGPRTAVVSTPLQYYDNRGQSPFTGVNETVKDGYMPQQQLQQSTVQQYKTSNSSAYNHQRDLAYRPSIPQGWKAPTLTLPRDFALSPNCPEKKEVGQPKQHNILEPQELQCQKISDAVGNCEAFSNMDEKELIGFLQGATFEPHPVPDYDNHLARSPKCLVSPVSGEDMLRHEGEIHALQELTEKQQQRERNQRQWEDLQAPFNVVKPTEQMERHRIDCASRKVQQCDKHQQYFAEEQWQEEHNQHKQGEILSVQKQQQQPYEERGDEQQEYVKVAVRDLISTFELHTIAEDKKNVKEQQMEQFRSSREKGISKDEYRKAEQFQISQHQFQLQHTSNNTKTVEDQRRLKTNSDDSNSTSQDVSPTYEEGLYVPKEIPLESYAPPPVVFSSVPGQTGPSVLGKSRFPTQSSQTSAGLIPSQPQQYPDSRSSGFDQGKQKAEEHSDYPQSRFSQRDNGYSLSYTPKQPHLPPNSYQTVPQETGYVPQVNFNPSPLPYDKLAKFENPSPSPRGISNVCRPVVMPGAYQRTRNASPDSFSANTSPCFASRQPNCSKVPGLSTSPRLNTIDLSRCQNFNNAARGWGTGDGCRNMPVGVTGSLPYTDF